MNASWRLGRCGIVLVVVAIACTTTVPPQELIKRNDHEGLTAWCKQEAARLRGKAEEMQRMAEEYTKPTYQLSPKESREQLIAHCQRFLDYYTKAAEEAEALAKVDRNLDRTIP